MGNKRTIIPFGPQHPVLPEPLHLKLVMEDERIIEAIPSIGYVHRGLEKLVEVKDFKQNIFIVERICGICSVMHALAYCRAIEDLMNVQIPPRAKFLRVIWSELHRMHSHLLWAGLLADSFGFESLFMQTWKVREIVMDLLEKTTGNRVLISVVTVGGTRKDLSDESQKEILDKLSIAEKQLNDIAKTFYNNYTVKKRTVGVGALSKEDAYRLSATGPLARASGIELDFRMTGYEAYGDLEFVPVIEKNGDCYSRMLVRIKELFQSIDLIRQAIGKIPDGEHLIQVKGNPNGETISRVEQPRGEVFYYVKANGTQNIDRLRVKTPTFSNIAPLINMLPGCDLADVPVIILSIDPCISCTER